jgi:hypothetical protein
MNVFGMTTSSQGNSSALFFVPSQPLEMDTLPSFALLTNYTHRCHTPIRRLEQLGYEVSLTPKKLA